MKDFIRKFLFIAFILLIGNFLYAQQEIGTTNPNLVGNEAGDQMIREVSIDKFEHDGFWRTYMSGDSGYVMNRLFRGAPSGKEPIPEEEGLNIPDDYVLGARVDFLRRGHTSFTILATRPIPVEGITKIVSVWVAGRNFNHELTLLISDYFGRYYEFSMGRLNFTGWQRMYATIPPAPDDGMSGVIQRSYNYTNHFGIKILGFRIDCDPMEARGNYYVYFDDLRAQTDLYSEHNRDPDDMVDGW